MLTDTQLVHLRLLQRYAQRGDPSDVQAFAMVLLQYSADLLDAAEIGVRDEEIARASEEVARVE